MIMLRNGMLCVGYVSWLAYPVPWFVFSKKNTVQYGNRYGHNTTRNTNHDSKQTIRSWSDGQDWNNLKKKKKLNPGVCWTVCIMRMHKPGRCRLKSENLQPQICISEYDMHIFQILTIPNNAHSDIYVCL